MSRLRVVWSRVCVFAFAMAAGAVNAAPQCTAIFSNAVQSHSASGRVDFGYMSRVNGSGNQIIAPSLTMTHTYQDQAARCDGVTCTATGTYSATSTPTFLTGSAVPATFLTSTGSDGAIAPGYQASMTKPAGNYTTVNVDQAAVLTFSTVDGTYKMGAFTTNYQSTVEFQSGDYWINGDITLAEQTTFKRLAGSTGKVRLYVSGNWSAGSSVVTFSGFTSGQLEVYVRGNFNSGNNMNFPGPIHANGTVTLSQNTVVSGGVYSQSSFSTGNSSQITYPNIDATNKMGAFTLDHQATIEYQPGDYWYNGNFTLVEGTLKRLTGSSGPVRIFVNGDIDIRYAAKFSGFTSGQLLIYASGKITINSQQLVPAFLYAAGDIEVGYQSGVNGAISGNIVKVGQQSVIYYVAPANLEPLCSTQPVQTCFTDDFNRSDLGTSDWAVTSRGPTSFTPLITNNRLRLTSNGSNIATATSLLRLLPASSNFVTVQFKYYGYGGNGADGVAVILSDATLTPQPGGYGGSLGYSRINSTAGFAGGWLGIALDEYGNYSNPTEGRSGGPGFIPDAVAIRGSGSGTSGYAYIGGTGATLSPGIDVSGSTAGPGHTYKITIDNTTVNKSMVKVERDTGSGFTTLISSFDAATATGQAALPTNFYLSLTGSTGGSNNVHELDDMQICATQMNPVTSQIDHFELTYTSPAVTCNPQPITIKACANASCSSLYTGQVSVPLTLSKTNSTSWTAISPATLSGSTLTFTGGSASVKLRSNSIGDVTIGVGSSTPAAKPLSVTTCSTTGCVINYQESGFIVTVPPNMIAAKPVSGSIQAVKKGDTSTTCVPSFSSVTRAIKFTTGYTSPTKAESLAAGVSTDKPIVVNGTNVTTNTTLNLAFDASGTAPLTTVRYDDAGQMTLTASYTGNSTNGDPYLEMTGSATFVSKPYGLCLQTDSSCSAVGFDNNCKPFANGAVRAGDGFPLRISAVGWQSDGEVLTAAALCSGNVVTPKFAMQDIGLTSELVAPANGVAAVMSPDKYNHVQGAQTAATTSVSEVGVFRIKATPTVAYYQQSVSGGTSDLVGRFIPAYLGATGSASLTPSCGTAFSYQGQPIAFATGQEPSLTVTGYNRQGAITQNYDRGDFWRLLTPGRDAYSSVISGRDGLNARLESQGSASLSVSGADDGDGARSYRWSGEKLLYRTPYSSLGPSAQDNPVTASVRQGFPVSSLTDEDGACNGSTTCSVFSYDFGGTEVRLGRLRIGSANGSELQDLNLPVAIESWQTGNAFKTETLDTCTTASVLGAPALDTYTGSLSAGETTAQLASLSAGVGVLRLTAPGVGNDGSVQAFFSATPSWLQFDWSGAGAQAARGLASFGTYKGQQPLIYRRELYR